MYKILVANEFNNDDSIIIENHSLDDLHKDLDNSNFIAHVHASSINPFDIQKLQGSIFTTKVPFIPGSEASGIIIESMKKELIGKKVSFSCPLGAWREYALVSNNNALILNDDTDLDSASCGFINPLTCQGLIIQAQKHNAKGIVNLAATSVLGKMINDLAQERGINCLNVIRGDQSRIDEIKQTFKNQNVITHDQDPESFQKQIREYSEKLSATVCFDPIGGVITGQVFNNLPPNSTLISYGSLSGKDIEGINGVQLRQANKKIEGFVLFTWLNQLSATEMEEIKGLVLKKFNTTFKTKIEKAFQFSEIKAALTLFRSLKGGKKIILKSGQ